MARSRALLDNPDLRQRLVRDGHERARKYSWRGIALMYLELMAQVDRELG